jgi:predicted dehydrogenase
LTLSAKIPASVTVSTTLSVSQNHRIRVWSEKGMLELANTPGDDYYDGFKLSFQPAKNVNPDLIAKVKRYAPLSKMEACFPNRITVARRVVEEFARALAHRGNIAPTLEDALKVQKCMEMARRRTP